jgi:hypothetical protein
VFQQVQALLDPLPGLAGQLALEASSAHGETPAEWLNPG